MARNTQDFCIFCNEAPCVCNKPAEKPKRAPRVVKAKPEPKIKAEGAAPPVPPVRPKVDPLAAMKALAAERPVKSHDLSISQKKPVNQRERDEEVNDPGFASAVRALSVIMAPEEKVRYAKILNSKPSREERLVTWRRRNEYRKEV